MPADDALFDVSVSVEDTYRSAIVRVSAASEDAAREAIEDAVRLNAGEGAKLQVQITVAPVG